MITRIGEQRETFGVTSNGRPTVLFQAAVA
jgi:hypothetical protein